MKKLTSETRIVIFTVSTVAVIFCVVMAILYLGARRQALKTALRNEQTDLNRNIELLQVMMRYGIPAEEVREIATRPWKDGSGDYTVTQDDSTMPQIQPGNYIIDAETKQGNESIHICETLTEEFLLEPVRTPLKYLIGIGVFTLLLLVLAVRYAIMRVSRPEVRRRERLNAELSVAERIQRGLTPSVEKRISPAVDAAACLMPAKEIAGDFYNLLTLGERLHFIVGDVSGKGVPAALFMAVTSKLYASSASFGLSPAEIAAQLNDELCRDNPEAMFCTAIIGCLDLDGGNLELCSAGHTRPLVFSAGEAPQLLEAPCNIPLGVMPGMVFSSVNLSMAHGRHLLIYTDGVTEAEDNRGIQMGTERLIEILTSTDSLTAEEAVGRVMDACSRHARGAAQHDDITLLDIKLLATRAISIKPATPELARLYEFAAHRSMPDRMLLAVEEAVANVINHSDATAIDISYTVADGEAVAVITDDGRPFDPTAVATPDTGLDTDCDAEIAAGGKGIPLIKSLSKSVAYLRNNNFNILTITQSTER